MATGTIDRPETDTTRGDDESGEATTEVEAADRPIPDFSGEPDPGGEDE